MIVPAYVRNLLQGAKFEFVLCSRNEDYAPGYTVTIRKRSDYQTAKVFNKEIEKLQKWVNRQPGGNCKVLLLPKETHHCKQVAVITIYDPIMLQLEKLGVIGGTRATEPMPVGSPPSSYESEYWAEQKAFYKRYE